MHPSDQDPDLKHLVLLGGGHAQVAVLKSLMMKPVSGLRTTLISRDILTPYSGMLPGYIEGQYRQDEITIDLSHLARSAGVRFIHGSVDHLDADRRKLTISDSLGRSYPEMGYDLLSVNIGSSPDLSSIPGAKEHAIPVKPISQLLDQLHPVLDQMDDETTPHLLIIGGGAGGVEMTLSLHHRLNIVESRGVKFTLISRNDRILPEFPKSAADLLRRDLSAKNINCIAGSGVAEITKNGVVLENGQEVMADHVLAVTAGRPAAFLGHSGLALDDKGFIAVAPSLQSLSHPDVFAAGDIATIPSSPRPKAGVFAVRAGPILTYNLRQSLIGGALKTWQPQQNYLALIGTGGQKAIAIRGKIVTPPMRWLWHLKEWIDRRFIEKFSKLPVMPSSPPSALAQKMAAEGHDGEAALAAMRCLGCGAKTGFSDLDQGIKDAEAFLKANGMIADHKTDQGSTTQDIPAKDIPTQDIPGQDIKTGADAAVITLPQPKIIQSVDAISAIIDDPFLLGRVAALHALSDLFASHAKPHSALAILTLPHAFSKLQKNDITQILAGAMMALHEHGAQLVGGHTSAGPALQVGFAVTGLAPSTKEDMVEDGDLLILTKPLGIGVIMAAHGQGHPLATGMARQRAIEVMASSNGHAAKIIEGFGHFPMTDITGFGLARHGLSLAASLGDGTASLEIDLDEVPIIYPALDLAQDGVASSLFNANRVAAPTESRHPALPLIYDPQTGGGLLAVVPKAKAPIILQKLHDADIDAAVIGRISVDGNAQIRV